jgi:hypothetical protein
MKNLTEQPNSGWGFEPGTMPVQSKTVTLGEEVKYKDLHMPHKTYEGGERESKL